MKKIALILALVLSCAMLFSCGEPKAKDILDDDGNVVATGYYKGDKLIYKEESDDKGQLEKITHYDDEGKVEKLESYIGGKKNSESTFEYTDKDGDYTEKKSKITKGTVIAVTENKYECGRLVLSKTDLANADENSKSDIIKYSYDDEKGTTKEEVFSGETKVRETLTDKNSNTIYSLEINEGVNSVKTFYEDKKISKIENYNKDGKLIITIENEYDADGVLKGTKSYNADGQLREYSQYVYREGKLLGIYNYNADGTIASTVVYDSEGKATIHKGEFVSLD